MSQITDFWYIFIKLFLHILSRVGVSCGRLVARVARRRAVNSHSALENKP